MSRRRISSFSTFVHPPGSGNGVFDGVDHPFVRSNEETHPTIVKSFPEKAIPYFQLRLTSAKRPGVRARV